VTRRRSHPLLWLVFVAPLFAVACSSTKEIATTPSDPPKPEEGQGVYKIGQPYVVDGVMRTPQEYAEFEETGIASWYGRRFHGRRTANGEIYDMNDLTAAHPTLQLPSIVRVTNLENGRSIALRVNDRGPFAANRVIDVSRRAAQLLGFEREGTAKVRIQLDSEASRDVADAAKRRGVVRGTSVASLPTLPGGFVPVRRGSEAASRGPSVRINESAASSAASLEPISIQPVAPTAIYVQVGAFSETANFDRVRQSLKGLGKVAVTPGGSAASSVVRVRLGPVESVREADSLLGRVIAIGYKEARIIVD
jgi:rare lipoprotein A